MSKVVLFIQRLLTEAKSKYGENDTISGIEDEGSRNEVTSVLNIIEDLVSGGNSFEEDELLDQDFDGLYDMDHGAQFTSESTEEGSQISSSSASQGWEQTVIYNQTYSLDQMKSVLAYYDSRKSDKLGQTQRRFPFVTGRNQIYRFKEYVDKHGTKPEKLTKVEESVLKLFMHAREQYLPVRDNDLKRWGIKEARCLNLKFVASNTWVRNFKLRNKIVSRKITRLVSTKQVLDEALIRKSGEDFVKMVKHECANIPTGSIFNFDQSGFSYEFMPKRTLSQKGEKITVGMVQNMNAGTHSYTIMPLLSMEGKLTGKLLICLQEPKGKLGPQVRKSLKIPKNVHLQCSKSGKLDKKLMEDWVVNCLRTSCEDRNQVVLIHDSWSGQTDDKIYASIPNIANRFRIPPHTTCSIQPEDVYLFRQYKLIFKVIRDRIMLDEIDINMHNRQNIVNMHSLIYNQITSKKFEPMLKYSWYACGYVEERAGRFDYVNGILFDTKFEMCDEDECICSALLRCSHCGILLCFDHFFNKFHWCN